MSVVPYLSAAEVLAALEPREAVRALEAALRAGHDPTTDPARSTMITGHGQLLIMPSEVGDAVGVKLAAVAPGNPERGLPRIQGTYVLFDGGTLTPIAIMDGAALTTVRTPAVSIAAVKSILVGAPGPVAVVVFGAGPQGLGHLMALASVLAGVRELGSVTFVVRNPDAVGAEVEAASSAVLRVESRPADQAIREASLIICATTARKPLFDGSLVADDAVVIAVGSHEPEARELDGALLGRSDVIVEDRNTALREAGDVIQAIAQGALAADELIMLADVVTGSATVRGDRPVVFKSTGMAWEDLVVGQAVFRAFTSS